MEQTKNIIGTEINTRVHRVYTPDFDYRSRDESINFKRSTPLIKTNVIGKVRIAWFFVAVSLLSFLFVYNFIAMNNIKANITYLENSIQSEQIAIEELKSQINSLSEDSAIIARATEAGYSAEIPLNDGILIVNVPKSEIVKSQPLSNWFNDFCEFVSSIFGG